MLLYFPEHKLRFVKVPKNACSTVITTLGYGVTAGRNPHDYDFVFARPLPNADEWPVIGVYRDPYDRVVSAYLNKIVSSEAGEAFAIDVIDYIWQSQRGQRRPSLQHSVTLREFAIYVCGHNDAELDQHWRSQSSFFDQNPPDIFFDMERLSEQWSNHAAVSSIPLRRHAPHAVNASLPFGEALPDMPGEAISGFCRVAGAMPEKSRFFDHHIAAMIRHRYAKDYQLIERLSAETETK